MSSNHGALFGFSVDTPDGALVSRLGRFPLSKGIDRNHVIDDVFYIWNREKLISNGLRRLPGGWVGQIRLQYTVLTNGGRWGSTTV